MAAARGGADQLRPLYGDDPDLILTDRRYGFINGITREAPQQKAEDRLHWTRYVDDVMTH